MRIILITALSTAVVVVVSTACSSNGQPARDGVRIVAAVYPLEEAATRVGGADVSVDALTPPGVEPHDLELTPRDLETIAEADLILYIGGGFQPAVEDAIASAATAPAVDVLSAVGERTPLLDDPDGELANDPHVWLSPSRYLDVVAVVERALIDVDPSNEAAYRAAADAWTPRLDELAASYDVLDACDRDLLVTGHEAFGYLAADHGLRQVGISGVSPDAEPGSGRLAEIRQLVEDEGVTTVFTEELLPADAVETIAAETGARVALLHTIETRTTAQEEAGLDYEALMTENLAALEEGLGCG